MLTWFIVIQCRDQGTGPQSTKEEGMLQGKSAYQKPIHCFKNKHVKKSKMHVEGNTLGNNELIFSIQCMLQNLHFRDSSGTGLSTLTDF